MKKITEVISIEKEIEKHKIESFQQLFKNKEIALFMKQHHLTPNKMQTYWSELLNFEEDHKQCIGCTGLNQCPKVIKGMKLALEYDDGIKTTFEYCQYGEIKKKQTHILKNILYNNIVTDQTLYDFKKVAGDRKILVNQAMINIVFALTKYDASLKQTGYYIAYNGEEKTKVLISFMNKLASQNYQVGICKYSNLINEIKDSFNQTGKDNYLKQLMNIPYLLIEGLGEENITSWARDEILIPLLEYRLLNKLPTFISSYFKVDDLKEVYLVDKTSTIHKVKAEKVMNLVKNLTKTID